MATILQRVPLRLHPQDIQRLQSEAMRRNLCLSVLIREILSNKIKRMPAVEQNPNT